MAEEEVFNAGNSDVKNIKTEVVGYGDADKMPSAGEMEDGAAVDAAANPEEKETSEKTKPVKKDPKDLVPDEDGILPFVDHSMLIGDIIELYPDASLVFMRCGMYCVTCPASQMETLEMACAVHGLDADDVAKVLNDYLTEQYHLAEEEAADREAEAGNAE